MYKLNSALISLLIFLSVNASFAQDNGAFGSEEEPQYHIKEEIKKPASRIGIALSIVATDNSMLKTGAGFTIASNQTLSNNLFLSLNFTYIGYYQYENSSSDWRGDDIQGSVGINMFFTQKHVRPYAGIELGWRGRYEHWLFGMLRTGFLLSPTVGVSYPVSPKFSIDANAKLHVGYDDFLYYTIDFAAGMNIGVSYLIP